MKLIEGDYDPEQFEMLMQEMYGDDFYQQEDSEWKTDADVRSSLLQDEDGRQLVGGDDEEGGLYDDGNEEDEEEEHDKYDEMDDGESGNAFESQQEESAIEKKLKAKMEEVLDKMDYEDIVAGMPTRFKYRKVEPNNYGLSTEDILFARDSTLKQYVSLKKMAPYRENGEYRVSGKKRRRFKDLLEHDVEEQTKEEGLTKNEEGEEEQFEESEGKKKKRRRQKKGKKKDKSENDIEATMDNESAVAKIVGSSKQEASTHAPGEKKVWRTKKGTKSEISCGDATEAVKSIERGPSPVPTEMTKVEEDKKKKRKKNKKKKSKNGVTVEGVSRSRLGAYGL
jgi:protein KRI1